MTETTTTAKTLEVAAVPMERLPLSDNPPRKINLNANHKKFIKARLSGKSNTDAYMEAYDIAANKRDYARMAASRLMITNDDVRETISRLLDESTREAQDTLNLVISEAAATVAEIMTGGTKEDTVRLRAAEYIIDRGLGKPRTDVNIEGQIKGDITIVTAIQRPKEAKDGDQSD